MECFTVTKKTLLIIAHNKRHIIERKELDTKEHAP